jgi:1-acyl-sn-glycerol-3-phosphate acyltransferase
MNTPQSTPPKRPKRPFIPARPAAWLIRAAQEFVRAQLSLKNKLELHDNEIDVLKKLPQGAGVVLTSNHADETDPRVCIELSRRSGKRFISMCNREAFDENFGLAGWALQRLGHFSVERGAHDTPAKVFAVEVTKQGRDVLVVFPEGEIFYMNEVVQPFHSGAIDIGMQAIIENREKTDPNWTAYIVPMAIKYHHEKPIESILEKRISKMEHALSIQPAEASLPRRILAIQKLLLKREEALHNVKLDSNTPETLEDEIRAARRAILSDVEVKHGEKPLAENRRAIDESWKLGAELREVLAEQTDIKQKAEIENDIATLREVAQLASWHPYYYESTTSHDRMAEAVLKLERELYRIKRPAQLTTRKVFVKFGEPMDLGVFIEEYVQDAHAVRHKVTEQLQQKIQGLLDTVVADLNTPKH